LEKLRTTEINRGKGEKKLLWVARTIERSGSIEKRLIHLTGAVKIQQIRGDGGKVDSEREQKVGQSS